MTQRESRLSRKIMDALREKGVFCFKVHGSQYTMAGLPDIVGVYQGLFLGLEVKLPENRGGTTARQRLVGSRIIAAGGTWAVVCSVGEALAVWERLEARKAGMRAADEEPSD